MDVPKERLTVQMYEVNGVRYERLEDVPAEYRKFFVDEDGNDTPDAVRYALVKSASATVTPNVTKEISTTTVTGNMNDLVRDRLLRDKSRPAKIRCATCSYDLAGTPVGGKCPECGTDVVASIMKLMQQPWWYNVPGSRSSRSLMRVIVIAALMLLGFVVLLASRCEA